jgi:hypothetical protein
MACTWLLLALADVPSSGGDQSGGGCRGDVGDDYQRAERGA